MENAIIILKKVAELEENKQELEDIEKKEV